MYPVARLGDDLPFLENRLAGAHLWVAKVCLLRSRMLLGVFNIGVDLRARLIGDNTGITVDLHVDFVEMLPPMPEAAHSRCAWATNIGSKRRPKPIPPHLHGSWQMLMLRSNSRSSTFRSESGKRMYIMTTSRITSGEN
jgi:hypothetical protein